MPEVVGHACQRACVDVLGETPTAVPDPTLSGSNSSAVRGGALPHEQPATQPGAEHPDVVQEIDCQVRAALDRPGLAGLPLLKMPTVSLVGAVCPLLARVGLCGLDME